MTDLHDTYQHGPWSIAISRGDRSLLISHRDHPGADLYQLEVAFDGGAPAPTWAWRHDELAERVADHADQISELWSDPAFAAWADAWARERLSVDLTEGRSAMSRLAREDGWVGFPDGYDLATTADWIVGCAGRLYAREDVLVVLSGYAAGAVPTEEAREELGRLLDDPPPSKRDVLRWETVATFVATFSNGATDGACDVDVRIGQVPGRSGCWFIRTEDDANGCDEAPDTRYPTEDAAIEAASEYADEHHEGLDGETAEEYLARRRSEDEDEDEDETITINHAGIEDAAHAFVAHLADDGYSGDQIIKKLIDWTSDDCFEAASIAPKIIDSLDDDQRAELFIEIIEMIESEVVRAIKDYCDDGNDDDDDAE